MPITGARFNDPGRSVIGNPWSWSISSLYNPAAYGSVPVIPPTSTNRQISDLLGYSSGQDITSTQGSTRSVTDTSSETQQATSSWQDTLRNIINQSTRTTSWMPNIPQWGALAGQASSDVLAWLRGQLEPDALADAATWAAQRGIRTGVGMLAPNAMAAYQHFLGLSRQQMQERGLSYLLQMAAQFPRTTSESTYGATTETGRTTGGTSMRGTTTGRTVQDVVSNQIVNAIRNATTGQQGNVQNITDNNVLAALYRAAPNPYAAAMANLAASQMGRGAGAAAGGGVSFPRSLPTGPMVNADSSNWLQQLMALRPDPAMEERYAEAARARQWQAANAFDPRQQWGQAVPTDWEQAQNWGTAAPQGGGSTAFYFTPEAAAQFGETINPPQEEANVWDYWGWPAEALNA